jgi:hypothetical protein
MKLQRGTWIMKAKPRRSFKVVPKGGAWRSLRTTKAKVGRRLRTISKSEPAHDQRSAAHTTHATQEPISQIELNPRVDYESRRRNDNKSRYHSTSEAQHRGGVKAKISTTRRRYRRRPRRSRGVSIWRLRICSSNGACTAWTGYKLLLIQMGPARSRG